MLLSPVGHCIINCMKVHIDLDTKTFVRFWLVVIGFALAALAIYSMRPALIVIGISLFLALALNAPVSRLAKIVPGRSRILATALAYLAVLAFLGVFIFLVIPPIVQQTAKFAQTVPNLVETATDQYAGISEFADRYDVEAQVDDVVQSVRDGATQFASGVGTSLITGIGSALTTIATGFLVLVMTFLMLIEGPRWMKRLWGLYGDKQRMEYHKSVVQRMYRVVTNYVTGQLSVAAVAAVFSGIFVLIMAFLFDVPYNLAIPTAAIVFVLSLIPLFGATIAGILVSLLLILNDLTPAILYALFFIVYQQVENNYILPKIQAKQLSLSPLTVLIAVTIGIYLFGIAGGIISIPIAGCVNIAAEEYLKFAKKRREQNAATTTTED